MLSEVFLDIEICEKVQHGGQIQPTPEAESVVDYPRSHVNQSNDELNNLKFYHPPLPLWSVVASGSETVVSVEHHVDERVEREVDGEVGIGVLAVGLGCNSIDTLNLGRKTGP